MRALLILLLLASCSVAPTNYSNIGQLYSADGAYGTAFPVAYAADGFYVLTCQHVVRGLDVGFTFHVDGMSYYDGMVVWVDEEADTALVGFTSPARPDLYVLTAEEPQKYSRGIAAGYPLGVKFLVAGPVMFQGGGVINHVSGPGGSGGPVFNEQGRVCGIISRYRAPNTRFTDVVMFGWIVRMSHLGTVIKKIDDL